MDCNCEEKGLIVWRGFDTRFLDVDWLSISFETRFQTDGFRAKFTICDYSFEWNDLTQPKIINLTDTQTATIPIGLNYGELIVWDDDGNSKPFSTSIPIFCKNWAESDQELDTYNMTVNALLDNETQMVIKIETAKMSLDWVLEKIEEHNASEEAHPYIQDRIDDEATARENADSALSDRIDEKQDKLTSENAGDGISIEEVGGVVKITNTRVSAEWGNILGILSDQLDLQQALDLKAAIADIGNGTLSIQKNGTSVGTFTANQSENSIINIEVPTKASDVGALPNSTKYGSSLSLSINQSTYVMTVQLKDQDGNNLGSAGTVDLPLESVVVNGSYDSVNKKIVLTLQNGNTIDIPVGDLVSGLQTEITAQNKLSADLVDDSTTTNKFVTSEEKTLWNNALQPSALNGYATEQWVQNRGYITQAVDDNSTTSTTLGWSASKLNGIIGDIETTINTIRGV